MPSKDPIGEAFGVSQDKPEPKPVVAAQSQPGWLNQLFTIILIGVIGFLLIKTYAPIDGGGKDDQHHEQRDDKRDKKQDGKLAPKAGWLHVVRERQTPTPDEQDAYSKLAELTSAWAKAGGAGFSLEIRDTDDDEPSAPVRKMIDHAKSKGIDPPFVLYKTLDNELKGVIKLPSPTASESAFLEVFK